MTRWFSPIARSNVLQQQRVESMESSGIFGKIDNDEEGPDDGPANHIRTVKEPVSDHWSVSGQYHASILGPPGAYSDRFINSVIGKDVAPVGDNIGTCTDKVKQYAYQLPDGRRVAFFDSPGFDGYFAGDSSRKYPSNAVILGALDYALRTQVPGARFSYVLLLHIQSNNEPAFLGKEKRLFTKLCGDEQSALRVITTFWDDFSEDDFESISAAEERLAASPPESLKNVILDKQGVEYLRTGKALECKHIEGYLHPRQIIHQLLGLNDETTPPQPAEDCLQGTVGARGDESTMPDSPTTAVEERPPGKIEPDDGGSGSQTAANTSDGIELGGIMGELQALRDAQRRELDHLRDYTAKLGHATSTLLEHPTFIADLGLNIELKKKLEDLTKDHDHLSMKCEALAGQKEVLTERLKRMTEEMNDLVKKQQRISNSGSALADAGQPSSVYSPRSLSSGIPLRSCREQLLDAIKSFSVQLSEELSAVEREEEERKLEIDALDTARYDTKITLDKPRGRHTEIREEMAELAREHRHLKVELRDLRERESVSSCELDKEKKPQSSWVPRRRALPDRVQRLESTLKDLRGEIAKREQWIKDVEEEYEDSCEEWGRVTGEIEKLEHIMEVKQRSMTMLQDRDSRGREGVEMLRSVNAKLLGELDLLRQALLAPWDKALLTGDISQGCANIEPGAIKKMVEYPQYWTSGLVESLQESFVSMKLKQLIRIKRSEESYWLERQVEEETRQWKNVAEMIYRKFYENPTRQEACPILEGWKLADRN
ncbi:hypothetical protein H1R20_g9478, partial [Candolleomyces eurysporus]